MSDVTLEVTGLDEFRQKLNAADFIAAARIGMVRGLIDLQGVVKRKLNGDVLNNRTGALYNSIHYRMEEDAQGLNGLVGSFAGYPNPKGGQQAAGYARINEYGGTYIIPEHERRMTSVFGKAVEPYTQTVRAHTATYKEASFLRSSLQERRANIISEIQASLKEAVK